MRHPNFVGGIFHSDYARRSYLDLGVAPHKLRTFHNGFDPTRFSPRLTKDAARKATNLHIPGPLVVYAGRINEKKGLELVLDIAGRMPHVNFVLVGSEQKGAIEVQAERYPNVHIRPWQPFAKITSYLYAADLLIIPPSVRPLAEFGSTVVPLKVFNYLASGRPIIAPNAPDIGELLRHDKTHYWSRPTTQNRPPRPLMRYSKTLTDWIALVQAHWHLRPT